MGKLYGCWLDKNFSLREAFSKESSPYDEYYSFYERRVVAISEMAQVFVGVVEVKFPRLQGRIFISYPAIISAVGRYVNDIMHYKMWHNVKIANKAKMVAHTIKWLTNYQVVSVALDKKEYMSLPDADRQFVLEINTFFIGAVIRYFLSFFCDGDIPSAKSYEKIFYLIDTGQYDAKTAAVAFEGLIP